MLATVYGVVGDEAYIRLPEAVERPPDHPYNFGFPTAMGRLLSAHPRTLAAAQGGAPLRRPAAGETGQ